MKKILASLAAVVLSLSAYAANWSYTASPAPGTVESLSEVVVTFDGFFEMEIIFSDDITVTHNGMPVEDFSVNNTSYGSNALKFVFANELTAPGNYNITFKNGSLCGWSAGYTPYDMEGDITLTYTIEGEGGLDFSYTADPKNGAVVEKLDKVTLTFPNLDLAGVNESYVTLNGEDLGRRDYSSGFDENVVTFNFTTPISTPGELVILIPQNCLDGMKGDDLGQNPMAIELRYTIVAPVSYTLVPVLSRPTDLKDGGTISAELQLESFFFNVPTPNISTIGTNDESLKVTIKEVNGDYERSAYMKGAFGANPEYSYFSAAFGQGPVYNGEYIITIPKGIMGDDNWISNHEIGVSNAATEIRFTLIDGQDRVSYGLKPISVTPAAGTYLSGRDIATVTVTFPEGTEMAENATAMLGGVDVHSYSQTALFTKKSDGVFEAVFTPVPEESGNYRLDIAQGTFGEPNFFNGQNGKGSDPITIEYILDVNDGVEGIEVDNAVVNGVYNTMGVRVADRPEGLPAGLYIYGGKKIIIRK